MHSPVSRVPKSTIGLRRLFRSSTPDLQILKQKTLSANNPLTAVRRNEATSELTASDNEVLARRHGESNV